MTPEYLEEMADKVDTEQFWRLSPWDQMKLPPEQRWRLDAGVALRRYASHVREMHEVLAKRQSLLLTPLSSNGSVHQHVPTPKKYRDRQGKLL